MDAFKAGSSMRNAARQFSVALSTLNLHIKNPEKSFKSGKLTKLTENEEKTH